MPNTHEQQSEIAKRASVTISADLKVRADERAGNLDRNFSSYVRWLIKRDIEGADREEVNTAAAVKVEALQKFIDHSAAAVIEGEPHGI